MPLVFDYNYLFEVNGVNISEFTNPTYTGDILDIQYKVGEDFIEEFPLGTLNSPVDILFSQRLQTELMMEIPLGTLNSPLDVLWDVPEIGEMSWDPFPLNQPVDILFGKDNEDLLMYNLFLPPGGGGETSYAFVS
jgi:hypothetical protein